VSAITNHLSIATRAAAAARRWNPETIVIIMSEVLKLNTQTHPQMIAAAAT